jgi:hypothetical protein
MILCPDSEATRYVMDANFPVLWGYLKQNVGTLSDARFDEEFGSMWISNLLNRATVRLVTVIEFD